jgi:hypothetical protein
MNLRYPRGWYVYSLLFGLSSLFVFLGLHRILFSLLHDLGIAGAVVPVVTGLTNLSWYEMAFVVGGFVKSVGIFSALPFLGAILGCAGAILLHTRFTRKSLLIRAHLFVGSGVSLTSLAIVLLRTVRGYEDQWRLFCVSATLVLYAGWAYYFYRTRGLFASLQDRR